MLDDNVFAYLISVSVARTGKVKSCRSVSALRLRDDGGPRRVRDREGEG